MAEQSDHLIKVTLCGLDIEVFLGLYDHVHYYLRIHLIRVDDRCEGGTEAEEFDAS